MENMDEDSIKALTSGDATLALPVIEKFVQNNAKTLSFPGLEKEEHKRNIWNSLFSYLSDAPETVQVQSLSMIRILSRDKSQLDAMVSKDFVNILIKKARILDENSKIIPSENRPSDEVIIGSLMCLCNFVFNNTEALEYFNDRNVYEDLMGNCLPSPSECEKVTSDIPTDVKHYTMRLVFILTAKNDAFREMMNERYGYKYLVKFLQSILMPMEFCGDEKQINLDESLVNLLCEVLKTLFNFLMGIHLPSPTDSKDEDILQLVSLCRLLLVAKFPSDEKKYQLHSDIINIMTCFDICYYYGLSYTSNNANLADQNYTSEEIDTKALHNMVEFLTHKLELSQDFYTQNSNLSPVLTVMCKVASCCRSYRKYLKSVILPPLTDVHTRPEVGNQARNHLCRLLTTPVTQVRDLAAHFLFILCKENVGRMVKYTGYGNAAGLFATRGLLGQTRGSINPEYSSDSDSDTEEYLAMRHTVNPVTGCYEPPRVDPMAGYTEEQKEYEAMKLVNLMDQMNRAGIVQPCRIGADGRPEPIEHVLQLQEDLPNQQVKKQD